VELGCREEEGKVHGLHLFEEFELQEHLGEFGGLDLELIGGLPAALQRLDG
jgi:hypothetical protein